MSLVLPDGDSRDPEKPKQARRKTTPSNKQTENRTTTKKTHPALKDLFLIHQSNTLGQT